MSKNTEPPKKCFCARCFLPVSEEDRVDIENQCFHKICSMCCVCRTIPKSLKMFYGHMFCTECFKNHVLTRFRGEGPKIHSYNWWMQWAPGSSPETNKDDKSETPKSETPSKNEAPKRSCICTRCLQQVEEKDLATISGQPFHTQCAKCYFCQCVPKTTPKIYYGQVFCEECFHKHVLSSNKDNPNEFFRHCFDQWQNNQQFSTTMRDFMTGGSGPAPFVFMMQGQQPPFCRCGTEPQQEWLQNNEPKKSATMLTCSSVDGSFGNLTFENPAETDFDSFEDSAVAAAAQKIEKLTKYLNERNLANSEGRRRWHNFVEPEETSKASPASLSGWVDFQDNRVSKLGLNCPTCLWQCGSIFVNSDYFKNKSCMAGDNC